MSSQVSCPPHRSVEALETKLKTLLKAFKASTISLAVLMLSRVSRKSVKVDSRNRLMHTVPFWLPQPVNASPLYAREQIETRLTNGSQACYVFSLCNLRHGNRSSPYHTSEYGAKTGQEPQHATTMDSCLRRYAHSKHAHCEVMRNLAINESIMNPY